MKQYLKMADVFRDVVQPERFNYAMANPKATYTAHAINSHDELVQMNQELLAALEALFHETNQQNLSTAEKVIAKAKGGEA